MDRSISARLVSQIRSKQVKDHDLRMSALFLADAAANIVAGCQSEPGRCIGAWAGDSLRPGGACGRQPDAGRMALIYGALCHIQEVDDLHRASVVHPGCVVAPVLWAMREGALERTESLDGRAFLTAFLQGVEACTRVGMAVGPAHYKIWHNTATCGPFGAAIAAGALLGLKDRELQHAIGNAGTQAAGLWEFLESGAMSKHLHAGRAAEAGLVAAELASHGFTGPPRIFEGERGFFAGLCPDGRPETIIADPDLPWQIHETSIKPWPSCRHTHPAIDAALALHREMTKAGGSVDDIQSVSVSAYSAALDLCNAPRPAGVYNAKFSLQHCVAAALQYGAVTFESFETDARNGLARLRDRISLGLSPQIEAAYPKAWGTDISLSLTDGTCLTASRRQALGDPDHPLDEGQLRQKAESLLAFGGHPEPAELFEKILAMAEGGPLPGLELCGLFEPR